MHQETDGGMRQGSASGFLMSNVISIYFSIYFSGGPAADRREKQRGNK
jgi:hypothetical protein